MSEQQFAIQRLYVKDISFESPNAPEMFLLDSEWRPEVNMDLNVDTNKIGDNDFEVIIKVSITAKVKEKTAFLVEVNQAGIFTVTGFNENDLKAMIGAVCPNILFPYAREAVSDLIVRGGFPPLYLSPVNFDALYHEQLEKEKKGS